MLGERRPRPQTAPTPSPFLSQDTGAAAAAMATLYPSLEDMKGHQVLQVGVRSMSLWGGEGLTPRGSPRAPPFSRQAQAAAGVGTPATTVLTEKPKLPSAPPMLYPNLAELEDYMGLALSSEEIQKKLFPDSSTVGVRAGAPTCRVLGPPKHSKHLPGGPIPQPRPAPGQGHGALTPAGPLPGQLVAPLSGNNAGLRRAEIKPGVREIHLCKDERGKTGLQLRNIDQGIFVQLVKANSPASLVGLRFGDQILQIDGKNCTGWSSDKAHRALKKASPEKIVMVVRDRPFQRTVTVHKDSTGHVGVVVKKGKIVSLAKDSSAARNGLLTHHYICEVNGQNVIGMKDKQLMEVLADAGNVVTLTIIPAVIYEHMVKRLSAGLVKSSMDHSIPDL
ncbi:Syndecan binding protein 2 [Aix galericulata]|nr:Syndecan binding protein 2 [Aix galericulata]